MKKARTQKPRVVAVAAGAAPAAPPDTIAWRVGLIAVFGLIAIFAARHLSDADLGYHLRGGQWILENHRFPSKDTYTYTRADADYPDLHWLYQVLLYGTYTVGDYLSLSILNIVLVTAVFVMAAGRLRDAGAPRWMSALLLAVAVLSCELRFHMRPEILTWIFMSAMLWVLERRARDGRNDRLFLLPAIQVVWTNAEGLFGIGWGVMGAYLVSDLVHARKVDKKLWGFSALAFASSLVNPYFLRGAMLPFTYLETLNAASPFKQSIAEFQSPWSMGSRFTSPAITLVTYKAYCAGLTVLLLATIRRRRVHELLLAAVFFYLSATALRNIPLFVLATLPTAAASWRDVAWTWWKRVETRVLLQPAAVAAFTLVIVGFALRAVTSAHYVAEARLDRFGLGLDGETQPVGATEFLVRNQLDGRILNHMNVGGWLDWRRPGQVFIDGRTEVMGEELYAESMAALRKGGLAQLVAKYRPDILFFNPVTARQWVIDLAAMPEWRAVFLDEGACVFLRDGYASQIPALEPSGVLASRGLGPAPNEKALALLGDRGPAGVANVLGEFFRPAIHPNGLQAMAFFFQDYGQPAASEALFLECIRLNRGRSYDFYFNVGAMYFAVDSREKSKAAMERVLADEPDNAAARRILSLSQ